MIVWAHNSHIGDARATTMGQAGEWNIGQLARQKYGAACRSIGFSTYSGTVCAATDWDGPVERKQVQPARPDSYEAFLHSIGIPAFSLCLQNDSPAARALLEPMRERAIGVIYRPDSELASHYFHASLSAQFDAILHFDQTSAVQPLDLVADPANGEPDETFPSGL
jgi:erythromycin esterase-like protein